MAQKTPEDHQLVNNGHENLTIYKLSTTSLLLILDRLADITLVFVSLKKKSVLHSERHILFVHTFFVLAFHSLYIFVHPAHTSAIWADI
jgi:hypothetical protein